MKISDFISNALFHHNSGYYRKKNPIGKNADFITSPEISQVFGELLAAYILQISSTKNSAISFVEMGAGKGTLFFDILSSIKKLAEKNIAPAVDFLKRATFHIIEINEVLKKIQQEKLQEFAINWHENFAEFLNESAHSNNVGAGLAPARGRPQGSPLQSEIFFISNELFDCFPIDQFIKTDIGWCERLVDGEKFLVANFNPETHKFVEKELGIEASNKAPFSAVFEHSPAACNFMSQLCEALKLNGGIAINFDYGYEKNEFANTLQAVKNHQKVEVLKNPGEADITAHVNFAALDKISKNFSLNSSLISQAQFLLALGIKERRQNLAAKNPEINSAIDRLIAPDQMGELFKCHILWK